MKYFFKVFIFIVLLGSIFIRHEVALSGQIDNPLTVENAVLTVIGNYPTVQAASEALKASIANISSARSEYYPKLGAALSYTRLYPDPPLEVPGLGSLELFPRNNYDLNLNFRYNILNFGKTNSQVDLAKSQSNSAQNSLDLLKTNLAFQTIQIFYSILFLEKSIEVQNQQIKSLNDHVDITEKKVQSGSATNFDELTTKVKVAEAENQKIELQNLLNKEYISLKRLLGAKDEEIIQLSGSFSQTSSDIDPMILVSKAASERWEIKLAKDAENTALMEYKVAQSEYNPSLDLNFIYGGKNGYEPDLNEIKQDYAANLELRFPLFEGFKTPSKVKEAKAKLMAAKMNRWDIEQMVASDVRKTISDVKADTEKIDSTKLHVKLAEEALSQAKVRYESGVITNLDLINSETSLAQARLFNLQALHDYVISINALKKATGEKLWE